ncbi:transcription antitermination protein NusB [Spiroplasma sabaudiense Ar-1343]|uniref:Transcription antitermination protein NusB n=1 Tax=Spiroplasma sabaudiense Ar-1343 TaxID=1276257 RepID=W6AAM0_9MOLU|nr:transcription antitermination factor NusB [Spiroplasma sabaudiense]AHI53900.1 transcription antitermination protein NusB [Spiroplasma sabaudiense Ar-1343]
MEIKTTSNIARRKGLIKILYRFYILNCEDQRIKQELLDNFQLEFDEESIKVSLELFNKRLEYEDLASQLLSDNWTWNRIPNIFKAIIITGIFEIKDLEVPKTVVINEMVNLSRSYQPNLDSKFINAILDKID